MNQLSLPLFAPAIDINEAPAVCRPPEELSLRAFFRNKIFFARDRQAQAQPDHRALPVSTLSRTARILREQLEAGNDSVLSALLALAIGLPLKHCHAMPLRSATTDEWEICLDVEAGVTLLDIETLAPGRAHADASCASDALQQANGILVRPLPAFLQKHLQTMLALNTNAANLGALLPQQHATKHLLPGHDEPIATTLPRLLNTLGPAAIELGIDRYAAAMLTLDVRVVPTGKFYYGSISREDVWHEAERFYHALGWGEPADILAGMACGSAVTPKPETLSRWFCWMDAQLEALKPGRRYSLTSLIAHHNAYSRAAASLATMLIAARAKQTLPFLASHVERDWLAISDKRVGEFPGLSPITATPTMKRQLQGYASHCAALHERLLKLGFPASSGACKHLKKIGACQPVPLFFNLSPSKQVSPLGTGDLHGWWPTEFGLQANWPRHFWQRELRQAQVPASVIDLWVRHSLAGADPLASTATRSIQSAADLLIPAIEASLNELGISSFQGLGRRER